MGDLGDQWGKAGQPGMLRKGQAGQEGAEKRKEEKGKLLGETRRLGIGQSLKLQHLSCIFIILFIINNGITLIIIIRDSSFLFIVLLALT